MDGVFHGKPYEQIDDLGGFPIIFGETPISRVGRFWPVLSKPPKPWLNHQCLDPYMVPSVALFCLRVPKLGPHFCPTTF